MSKRYIDADKFVGNLKTDHWGVTNMVEVGIAIDKSVADVEEVRHGFWYRRYSKHIDHLGEFLKYEGDFCSICGAMGDGKYCSDCGAKMGSERKEENEG